MNTSIMQLLRNIIFFSITAAVATALILPSAARAESSPQGTVYCGGGPGTENSGNPFEYVNTFVWDPAVTQVSSISGRHSGPPDSINTQVIMALITPNGDWIDAYSFENYAGVPGGASYTDDFGPDWMIVPDTPLTAMALIICDAPGSPQPWPVTYSWSMQPAASPAPTPIDCSKITAASTIPAGFGSPVNVFSSGRELMLRGKCSPSGATFSIDTLNSSNLVYQDGYYYQEGFSTWKKIALTGSGAKIADIWYPQAASTYLGANLIDPSKYTYTLGYTCLLVNNTWKCGCRDSTCAQSYWQIQNIQP